MFMKKGIIFAVLSALVAVCGYATGLWDTAVDFMLAEEPSYVDFPLGQGKTITLDVKSSVREKIYDIVLRTDYEHVGAETEKLNHYYRKASEYPFEISVKGYKLDKNHQEVLFFYRKFIGPMEATGFCGDEPKGDVAVRNTIGGVRLPIGKYKFVITDNSAPNPVYQEMKNSIGIYFTFTKI